LLLLRNQLEKQTTKKTRIKEKERRIDLRPLEKSRRL